VTYGTRAPSDHVLLNGCLALVVIFFPLVGHVIWLIVVWVFWFIGPFLYLLLGQRRHRLLARL
jgi:hypothetical protein